MRFAAPRPAEEQFRRSRRSEDGGKAGGEPSRKSRTAAPAAKPAPGATAPGPRGRSGCADGKGRARDCGYEHVGYSGDSSRRPRGGTAVRARNLAAPAPGSTVADAPPRDVDGDHQLARLLQMEEDELAAAVLATRYMETLDAGLGTAIQKERDNSEAGASAEPDDRVGGGFPTTTDRWRWGRSEDLDRGRSGPAVSRADRGEHDEWFAGLTTENLQNRYGRQSTADRRPHQGDTDPPSDSDNGWGLSKLFRRISWQPLSWGNRERNSVETASEAVSPLDWTTAELYGVGRDIELDGYRRPEPLPQTWEADIANEVDLLGFDENMNYEELTALADRIGPAAEAGATEFELDTLRDIRIVLVDSSYGVFDDKGVLQMPERRGMFDEKGDFLAEDNKPKCLFIRRGTCCSICLDDYASNPLGSELSGCGHVFHTGCIKAWLRNRKTCPIDRMCVTF